MNRNYHYGKTSRKNISTVEQDLQDVCHEALKIANTRKLRCPDFGISHGYRSAEDQFVIFMKGRKHVGDGEYIKIGPTFTNIDGFDKVSEHFHRTAIDFYAIIDGKANYEDGNIALVATCFFEAASNLKIDIDWGGSFKSISDGAHIELVRED